MPKQEEFDKLIQQVLPFVTGLIPINWKVKSVISAAHDSEYFDGTTDSANALFSEGEGHVEFILNRDHPRFQSNDLEAEIAACLAHERAHANRFHYTKGLSAGRPKPFIKALEDYEDSWCGLLDRVVFDMYRKLLEYRKPKRKKK